MEDNPDDATLTLRAFRKSNVLDRVVLVRDGVEALDTPLDRAIALILGSFE